MSRKVGDVRDVRDAKSENIVPYYEDEPSFTPDWVKIRSPVETIRVIKSCDLHANEYM
jgi:hypothetical protein